MARRNTAYWPERYTPLSLLEQAAKFREKAAAHYHAAGRHVHAAELAKNAAQYERHVATLTEPNPTHQNGIASIYRQASDAAVEAAEALDAAGRCPDPVCFAVVYREPEVEGVPEHWIAEVYECGDSRGGTPILRTYSTLDPALCLDRAGAVAELRSLARNQKLGDYAGGEDYQSARVRSAVRCAFETEPAQVRIRLACEERPDNWEQPK